MRTLIVTEFISLDGVMQAPGGEPGYAHTGWVGESFTDELGAYKGEEQLATETLVLGRITYEGFKGAWPDREGEMADKINTMDKYVVSTTLEQSATEDDPRWTNTNVVRSIDDIAALKAGDGGDIIVVGSRTLAQSLLVAGHVDELHLQVFPVLLGSGERLFPTDNPAKLNLELTGSKRLDNGVMLQEYAVGA